MDAFFGLVPPLTTKILTGVVHDFLFGNEEVLQIQFFMTDDHF